MNAAAAAAAALDRESRAIKSLQGVQQQPVRANYMHYSSNHGFAS